MEIICAKLLHTLQKWALSSADVLSGDLSRSWSLCLTLSGHFDNFFVYWRARSCALGRLTSSVVWPQFLVSPVKLACPPSPPSLEATAAVKLQVFELFSASQFMAFFFPDAFHQSVARGGPDGGKHMFYHMLMGPGFLWRVVQMLARSVRILR